MINTIQWMEVGRAGSKDDGQQVTAIRERVGDLLSGSGANATMQAVSRT
jgi:hypothetical protein